MRRGVPPLAILRMLLQDEQSPEERAPRLNPSHFTNKNEGNDDSDCIRSDLSWHDRIKIKKIFDERVQWRLEDSL